MSKRPTVTGDETGPEAERNPDCRACQVLLVEPERALAQQATRQLDNTEVRAGRLHGVEHAAPSRLLLRVESVSSLEALMSLDRLVAHVVVCAMELDDGTGIDALAYVQAMHPTAGVFLYAHEATDAMVREAIMSGALDCVQRPNDLVAQLPKYIANALARLDARQRTDSMRRRLHDALSKMTDEIARLHHRLGQLESLAVTDELTGLYNRRYMNSALEDLWKDRRQRPEVGSLGCMILDIDRFKELNDHFGHQSGDAALYILGQVLRENCRKTDILTRYGGDEFCILMPDITMEEAMTMARRVENAFRVSAMALLQETFDVGLSIGVAIADLSQPRSAMQLIAHADEAMYVAKRQGHTVRTRGLHGVLAA